MRAGLVLGILAAVFFAGALALSPTSEAVASTLGAAGGAAATVAVTLVSVVKALQLEDRRRTRQEWRGVQVDLLREAHQWAKKIVGALASVDELSREAAYAADAEVADDRRSKAHRVAERFYNDGQELDRLEILVDLIEDEAAISALIGIDEQVRRWNEAVAGDHSSSEVLLDHNALADRLPAIRHHAEIVRRAYTYAVRRQYQIGDFAGWSASSYEKEHLEPEGE